MLNPTARALLRTLLALPATLVALAATVPVVALALPFWAVSASVRLASALLRRVRPHAVPWQELVEFEPVIGWKPRAGLDAHATGDRSFHLTTDGEGWRGGGTLAEAEVVALGDSFAFGTGVDDRDFFASQPVGVRIKGVGANGYSMVHALLLLERLSDRLAGKLVVWMVYYGNDLLENLKPNLGSYRMPFVREAQEGLGWEIVTHHVRPEPWPMPDERAYLKRLAELCCPGYLSRRAYAACEHLIARGHALCARSGVGLVVMGVPDPKQLDRVEIAWLASLVPDAEGFDPARPDRELQAICTRLGVRFVTLRDHLARSDYKDTDCHWNRHGHRRVADLLAELYRNTARPERPVSPQYVSAGA